MNNLELTAALATAPSSAFADLRARPRVLFPLLLMLLATAGLVYWYYSAVDIDWYKQTVLAMTPDFQKLDDDKRAGAMSMMTETTLKWGSTIGVLVVMAAGLLLQSLYMFVAAKVTKIPLGFKHWFSLVCWCSLPALLGVAVAAILLVLSETPQISPSVLQQLSLNELIFHVPFGPGYSFLSSLSIPAFLGWALMIVGVRTWTQRSWAFSAAMTLIYWVIYYGIFAFFSFR